MAYEHVALFRALNFGHRGSPSRVQLEQALLAAGAERVRSVQTNGSVLLAASDPRAVVAAAAAPLARVGYEQPAFVRRLEDLAAFVETGDADPPAPWRRVLVVRERPLSVTPPWTNAAGSVRFEDALPSLGLLHAVAIAAPRGGGDPAAAVERLSGGPATARAFTTIFRLLAVAERPD